MVGLFQVILFVAAVVVRIMSPGQAGPPAAVSAGPDSGG
jgi:hypothetical protein